MRCASSEPATLAGFLTRVVVFSIPLWVLGAASGTAIAGLPVSAVMFVVPGSVAFAMTVRCGGRAGVRTLLARRAPPAAVRWPIWCVATMALPAVFVIGWVVRSSLGLVAGPVEWSGATALAGMAMFLVAATFEEGGWSRFATPAARARTSIAGTGIVIGSAWAAWHVIPYVQAGHDLSWILWQCLFTIAARVVMVKMYETGAGSLAPVVVFHATINIGLIPETPGFYSPALLAAAFVPVALGIVLQERGRSSVRSRRSPTSAPHQAMALAQEWSR